MASRLDVEAMARRFIRDHAGTLSLKRLTADHVAAFARTVGRACAREAIGRVYGPLTEHQIRSLGTHQRWHARGRKDAEKAIRRALRPRRGKANE